jgi:hypothetical protein
MKTSIQLIEQIIRAKTALHLKLVAHRNGGKLDGGGGHIDDLLAEVDAGLSRYDRMLVLFKNEIAVAVMESAKNGRRISNSKSRLRGDAPLGFAGPRARHAWGPSIIA